MKITGHLDHPGATLCVATTSLSPIHLSSSSSSRHFLSKLLRHSTPCCLDPLLLHLKFHAITKITMLQWHSTSLIKHRDAMTFSVITKQLHHKSSRTLNPSYSELCPSPVSYGTLPTATHSNFPICI
jgi:hypothetical protein